MKRFVVPPSWPTPPGRNWLPPRTWRPDPSWPSAPADWKFWVNGKGKPVTGPVGLYGAPSRRKVVAGVSGAVLFIAVNFWALTAIGLFDGHQSSPQAFPVVDESPSPSATVTPTAAKSSTPPSTPTLVEKTTALPTVTPTKPPATRKPSPTERREPTPKKTKQTKRKPVPPKRTPTQTLTQEQILAAYCRQQGWDPGWCDPANWRTP